MTEPENTVLSRFVVRSDQVQTVLGSYAGVLLLLETAADSLPIEEALDLILLGLTLQTSLDTETILLLLDLTLLCSTVTVLSPGVSAESVVPRFSFGALTGVIATAYAGIFAARQGSGSLFVVPLSMFFTSIPLFALYFRLVPTDWTQFTTAFWQRLARRTTADPDDGPATATEHWLVVSTAAASAASAALIVGILCAGLLLLTPALEILVLLWVGASVIVSAVPALPPSSRTPPTSTLESELFDVVNYLGRAKGNYTVLIVVVGIVQASVAVVTAVTVAQPHPATSLSDPTQLLTVWNGIGEPAGYLAVGGYSFMFWLRIIKRAPAFLVDWYGDEVQSSVSTGRLPGAMVPLLFVSVPLGMQTRPALQLSAPTYAVLWPVGVLALVGSVALARRGHPQAVSTDGYVIPVAIVVQTAAVLLSVPYDAPTIEMFVMNVCLCLGLFYLPTVFRRTDDLGPLERVAVSLTYVGGFTSVFVLLAFRGAAQFRVLNWLLAGVFLLVSVSSLVSHRRDSNQFPP